VFYISLIELMAIKTQLNFLAMLEEIYFDEIMVKKEREIFVN